MSVIDDGGPAFPNNDQHGCAFAGMTLRDWFAGQALAGLIANEGMFNDARKMKDGERCYKQADAMLAARKGGAND